MIDHTETEPQQPGYDSNFAGADAAVINPERPIAREHVAGVAQVLAHRIRSLVTCIEAYGDLLGDTLARPEQRDLLFRIFESTGRIEHILSDLLLFSRPHRPAIAEVTLATIIEGLRVTLDEEVVSRLEIDGDAPPLIVINCDERLLRQALLALIKNAVEGSPAGSPIGVGIASGTATGGLVIAVENEGVLPAGKQADQIYQPFFSTRAHNLGLGLSIAAQIVAAHGGELFHRCAGGKVTFVIKLPL